MKTDKKNIKFLCFASADYQKSILVAFYKLEIPLEPINCIYWLNNNNHFQDDRIVLVLPEDEKD